VELLIFPDTSSITKIFIILKLVWTKIYNDDERSKPLAVIIFKKKTSFRWCATENKIHDSYIYINMMFLKRHYVHNEGFLAVTFSRVVAKGSAPKRRHSFFLLNGKRECTIFTCHAVLSQIAPPASSGCVTSNRKI